MMISKDFQTTILVDQTSEEVFRAINNVRGWWSEEISGITDTLNAEFLYHYQDVHSCKIKLIEMVHGKKVVWLVMENYFSFTEDESEWKDTKIIFEISQKGRQTQLTFTHAGLVPEYECFEVCKDGWSNYINSSLRNLIVTGEGSPNPKEGGFNGELVEKWNLQKQN